MQVVPKKHFFAILSSAVLELNPKRYQNTMNIYDYHGVVTAPRKWNFVMKVGVPLQFHFYEKKILVSKISTFI